MEIKIQKTDSGYFKGTNRMVEVYAYDNPLDAHLAELLAMKAVDTKCNHIDVKLALDVIDKIFNKRG